MAEGRDGQKNREGKRPGGRERGWGGAEHRRGRNGKDSAAAAVGRETGVR